MVILDPEYVIHGHYFNLEVLSYSSVDSSFRQALVAGVSIITV